MTQYVVRAGTYFRVAEPGWDDPLDGAYSMTAGGRWNAPGSFPVVYLNREQPTARANVDRLFRGAPYTVLDMRPEMRPVLIRTTVPEGAFVDAVTADGLDALGLPTTYPLDDQGEPVPRAACQPIGAMLWNADERGVACPSAAIEPPSTGEELGYFQREQRLTVDGVIEFDDWYM